LHARPSPPRPPISGSSAGCAREARTGASAAQKDPPHGAGYLFYAAYGKNEQCPRGGRRGGPLRCFTVWAAGGGIQPGITYGATDPFGYSVATDGVHVHDFQATVLHLLGIDHERLTYKHQGRYYRLTDVAGKVVKGIIT
jgi:hypothetical protein